MNQWSQMKPKTLLKALTALAERNERDRTEKTAQSGATPASNAVKRETGTE